MGGRSKERCPYHSLSLPAPFIKNIREHIKDMPEYRSVASFAKVALINQLNYERKIKLKEK